MRTIRLLAIAGLAGLFVAVSASAQVSGTAQAGAQTNANSSASAGPSGASNSAAAQSSGSGSAQATAGQESLSAGTTFDSVLSGSLDAKKNKPGDKVEARVTQDVKQDGHVVLAKGTRLIGHVTQAQAQSKRTAQSTLGIVFDSAILRNGEQIPMHLGIQALAESAAAAESSVSDNAEMMPTPSMGGGSVGGGGRGGGGVVGGAGNIAGGAVGGAASMAGNTTGAVGGVAGNAGGAVGSTVGGATHTTAGFGGFDAAGHLMSDSQGVFGMPGMQLASTATSDTQGSLIVSSTRNVHLDSGTQMLLRATGEAQ